MLQPLPAPGGRGADNLGSAGARGPVPAGQAAPGMDGEVQAGEAEQVSLAGAAAFRPLGITGGPVPRPITGAWCRWCVLRECRRCVCNAQREDNSLPRVGGCVHAAMCAVAVASGGAS
jgi:hypothetical protein